MNTRSEILGIVKRERLRMKRTLGQSFLLDDDVLARIAESAARGAAGAGAGAIVEIGAGLGTLTRHLASHVERVVAIEKDAALVPLLEERLHDLAGVKIANRDALEVDFAELAGVARPAIAGNLPYSITTPLLLHLLEHRTRIGPATVMIQREVALRIAAAPGGRDYGSLTVLFRLHADIEALFDVGPESFYPVPKVDSTVLRIEWLEGPRVDVGDPIHFERSVRAAFSRRRKTLRNSLASAFDASAIAAAGDEADIDLSRRAETLTVEEFSRLASALPASSSRRGRPSDP